MNIGPKLDRIDLKILAQLQRMGRITNVELADAVGLSPSPCLTRVKRLEQAGYITGYGAQINLKKLGEFMTVFTQVTLADHRSSDFSRFESRVRGIDEIIECHLVSGGYDYLLKFVARGLTHYQSVIEGMLEGNLGIEKYFSYIVIKSPVVKLHYPIQGLFDEQNRSAESQASQPDDRGDEAGSAASLGNARLAERKPPSRRRKILNDAK